MNLLGLRAFSTELLKIATEVRDAEIRAVVAEAAGIASGSALATNSVEETNFKPKLAVSSLWLKKQLVRGASKATDQRLSSFTGKMRELSSSSKHVPIRAQANLSANFGKSTLNNRGMAAHFTKTEKTAAAGFMAYTPVGTFNVRGKQPTAQGSGYETASNFAGTALRGGMTGAGVATLANTLRHGHDFKVAPKHLGVSVAAGAGLALADRAFRRHAVKKQLTKMAMFSPARELHATQTQGSFEPKVHHTPLKPMAGIIGRPTGA